MCATQTEEVQNFTYVIPLLLFAYGCYAIDSHSSGLPHTFVKVRALFGNMVEKSERKDLKSVRDWAMAQEPSRGKVRDRDKGSESV